MSGSGTFAIEAALIAEGLPAGGLRNFQFQAWPSFGEAAWEYIKKKAFPAREPAGKNRILGVDISSSAVELARRNALKAGTAGLWETGDFFSWNAAGVRRLLGADENEPAGLVLNPPYGKRLARGGEELFQRLGNHIRRNFPGWKTLVLFPDAAALEAFGGRPLRTLRLRHGGFIITAGFF
jgi:putative N6-adenine-specific DNA methylase